MHTHIFDIQSSAQFNAKALEIFQHQAKNCEPYNRFITYLGINPANIAHITDIPFLPISLFKSHRIYTATTPPQLVFTSSGTTGPATSTHYVAQAQVYAASCVKGFERFFGDPKTYCILGLLPGYMERSTSSLVYMVNHLQQLSGHPLNGNFMDDFEALRRHLLLAEEAGQPTILIGVSFALLDFGAFYNRPLQHTTVIETGGMKGRRKELTRPELHHELQQYFGTKPIVSEYGMTELLSQGWYTRGQFYSPPWMKVLVRDKTNPMATYMQGAGGLNVIDLANMHSCSFIATGDAGQVYPDGGFNVLGRLDNQDLRGCNLLYEN